MSATIVLLFASSCNRVTEAPVPNLKWPVFDSSGALPLRASERKALEGIYSITEKDQRFGPAAALKWSYTATGSDTVYQLSFFCEKDIAYFICEGKRLKDQILLNGYWRKMVNTETGKVHFTMKVPEGSLPDSLTLSGLYGDHEEEPTVPIRFQYKRPLYSKTPFEIIGHRGGGRNNDLLPASENSLKMLTLAARFGSTGVEIDVKLTKDGVPVLYHDAKIDDRLTNKAGLRGPISDYTLAELQKEIRLKDGQQLPTLRQALQTVVERTPISYVWLDTKYEGSLDSVRALQTEFMNQAKQAGKTLEIVIGIPDEKALAAFQQLPDYKNIPSLCELDTGIARSINARIWAPMWTKGTQTKESFAMQQEGRRVYVWTMDFPDKISQFMSEGRFNGIATNLPSIVAYYYYTKQ
ncbi:MAG TPA: glycerophosphodiester phosphodiesterase family protein [Flavisolibacter sp.]|nr:glycerophosphodiester phosphodiesterase family protein [Flavisolibacter sp.]